MGISSIGFWEIGFVLIIALVIWGPNKLPEIARTLGKAVRTLKKASFDLTTAVTREIDATENKPTSPPQSAETKPAPSASKKTRPKTRRISSSKNE